MTGRAIVRSAFGQPGQACAQHTAALVLASRTGAQEQQARAHDGLARAHQAAADPRSARRHWQQALALYAGLGVPAAEQVRAQLTGAGSGGRRVP